MKRSHFHSHTRMRLENGRRRTMANKVGCMKALIYLFLVCDQRTKKRIQMSAHTPLLPSKAIKLVKEAGLAEAQSILADFAAAGLVKTYALMRTSIPETPRVGHSARGWPQHCRCYALGLSVDRQRQAPRHDKENEHHEHSQSEKSAISRDHQSSRKPLPCSVFAVCRTQAQRRA